MNNILKYKQYLILEQGSESCPLATQDLEVNSAGPSKSWANVKKVK